jgi:hypothetical protein
MPSKFIHKEDCVEDGLSIGIRQTRSGKYWWQARIYWKQQRKYDWHSLKLEYRDNKDNLIEARRKARKVYKSFIDRVMLNLHPKQDLTVERVVGDFLAEAEGLAGSNEANIQKGLEPRFKLVGKGTKPITLTRFLEIDQLTKTYVQPYFEDNSLWTRNIRTIQQRELVGYANWINQTRFLSEYGREIQVSPSRINKGITVIRLIWEYSMRKGFVDWVPNIDRPDANLEKRSRKVLDEPTYFKIVKQARLDSEKEINHEYHRDLSEQFYIWIKFLSWSGVRPSSGWTDRTLLRWSDIEIINEGTDSELWFINRTEKTQDFGDDPAKYIIQKPVIPDLKRLKLLYKERGISDPEFIFCHTKNGARGAAQGEVIKSFRRQWENLLTQIGIPNPKHAPQSERLSPYSIRGFYITMRLRYGKMNIDQIASACNTSAAMVRRIYRDWDIEQETESLTKGIPNYDESRQRRESANVI